MDLVTTSAIGAGFESIEFELMIPSQERKFVDLTPFVDRGEEMDSVRVGGTVGFGNLSIFECLILKWFTGLGMVSDVGVGAGEIEVDSSTETGFEVDETFPSEDVKTCAVDTSF